MPIGFNYPECQLRDAADREIGKQINYVDRLTR